MLPTTLMGASEGGTGVEKKGVNIPPSFIFTMLTDEFLSASLEAKTSRDSRLGYKYRYLMITVLFDK